MPDFLFFSLRTCCERLCYSRHALKHVGVHTHTHTDTQMQRVYDSSRGSLVFYSAMGSVSFAFFLTA